MFPFLTQKSSCGFSWDKLSMGVGVPVKSMNSDPNWLESWSWSIFVNPNSSLPFVCAETRSPNVACLKCSGATLKMFFLWKIKKFRPIFPMMTATPNHRPPTKRTPLSYFSYFWEKVTFYPWPGIERCAQGLVILRHDQGCSGLRSNCLCSSGSHAKLSSLPPDTATPEGHLLGVWDSCRRLVGMEINPSDSTIRSWRSLILGLVFWLNLIKYLLKDGFEQITVFLNLS